MEIILPKWLCEELQKRTDFSLQYLVKSILIETVNNPYEGYEILDKVKLKENTLKYKMEEDRKRESLEGIKET